MKRPNTVEEQDSKPFILGIYPKCPFYGSVQAVLIIVVLIALGTWGIYYLNRWTAVAYLVYSISFYFLVMPFTLCRYCYFRVTETTVDEENGRIERLLPIEKWRESNGIEKHVGQKHWTWLMTVIWFLPIVLIVISFFLDFSMFALVSLVGFVAVLVGNYYYMLREKCPTCAIKEECHSAFSGTSRY